MRRIILVAAFAAISLGATAQTMKVQSAYSDFKNNRLGYAKKNIDEACLHESTKDDPKTWNYAGMIYAKLVDASVNDQKLFAKQKVTTPVVELAEYARQALIKSIELEKAAGTNEYMAQSIQFMNFLNGYLFDQALNTFNDGKYAESIPMFENVIKGAEISRGQEILMKSKFYIAMAYDATKQKDKANELYRELVKSRTKEEPVYINLFIANKAAKEMDKAINVLKVGRSVLPNSFQILGLLAGAYQETGNKVEADKCIDELKKMSDGKPEVMVIIGDILRDGGNMTDAITIYNQALSAKNDMAEANFSLGVLYYNWAVDLKDKADALPLDQTEAYDKLLAESKDKFKQAIPYFEKILVSKPNDIKSLNALKTIYSRTEMNDKLKEVDAKLNAIRQQQSNK